MATVRSIFSRVTVRAFSDKAKPFHLVDTASMASKLEKTDLPSAQAFSITSAISEGLKNVLEHQDSKLADLKGEIIKSREMGSVVVNHEMEKLRLEMENMRSEMVSDFEEKLQQFVHTASTDKDNLRERINKTNAHLEFTKYAFMKIAVGTLVSAGTLGMAIYYGSV